MAFAAVDQSIVPATPIELDETFVGWTIGGGVEYAFTDKLIGRAEYRYSDFGTEDSKAGGVTALSVDLDTHDTRLGVAYKF